MIDIDLKGEFLCAQRAAKENEKRKFFNSRNALRGLRDNIDTDSERQNKIFSNHPRLLSLVFSLITIHHQIKK